ncbi:MAG: hypothetical protein RJA35_1131 [Actinomycetota bacterium]|jgi:LysM repeat protein
MRKPTSRVWALITTVVLALSGVVGLSLPPQQAKALSGSMFDPGLIIGDSVFYDFGTMTDTDIQKFLDQQVPKCKLAPAAAVGDFTCLRYYRTDIPAMPAVAGRCNAIDAQSNVLASTMIMVIARACNINPRVILVTLQKEQGLVTSTNPFWPDSNGNPSTTKPADYRYQIAMGFACPDTGPCTTFGFFYQVYKAASQFHWYGNPAGSFTYLAVGKTVSVNYNPDSSCGKKSFVMKSQATAALYYYTPYTPNQAALDNLYGSGDKCSAYGNRNFWRYYWDWFGSPIGGGFLLKSATSDTYLIVPNSAGGFNKYDIADPLLVTALAPLGPVGIVSQDYLDSFTDSGPMTRIVKSATNNYYFVDNGGKYAFSSCTQALVFGLSCSDAVQLTSYQLNALTTRAPMSALVPETTGQTYGPSYLITGGVKHEILDQASAVDAGLTLPAQGSVPISAFNYLPWGGPIARSGVLFTNRTNGNYALISGGKYYEIDHATSSDIDFKTWFPTTVGTLSDLGVDSIRASNTVHTIVSDEAGATYVLTPTGKIPTATGVNLIAASKTVATDILKAIPTIPGVTLAEPFLAKSATGKVVYWVSNLERRVIVNSASQAKLAATAGTPGVQLLPSSALAAITLGGPVLAPASLVTDPAGRLLLTDGLYSYVVIPDQSWAAEYGLTKKPAKVLKTDLAGYTSEGNLGLKVLCGGTQYLMVNGTWQPINDSYASSYPGIAAVLDPTTCAILKLGSTQVGRFVITPAKQIYLLYNGKRRAVTTKQYEVIRGTTPEAFKIDATITAAIPLGTPMPANYKTPLINPLDVPVGPSPTPTPTQSTAPTPPVTPTPLPTKSATPVPTKSAAPVPTKSAAPVPTKSATPVPSKSATPTPVPTATKAPSPTPTAAVRYYTVVSGDTLIKIANRFGVSVNALKAANGLTSDVAQLGRRLVIP